jgi:hypothetical protein
MPKPILQSLILADHVYEDKLTGKRIIAGIFNRIIRGVKVYRDVPAPAPPPAASSSVQFSSPPPPVPPAQQPPAPQPPNPVTAEDPLIIQPGQAVPEPAQTPISPGPAPAGTTPPAESAAHVPAHAPQTTPHPEVPAAPRPPSPQLPPPSFTPPPLQPGQRMLEIPPTGLQSGSPFAYMSLTEVRGVTPLVLQLVSLDDDTQLFRSDLRVDCSNPLYTIELTVPLPPIAPPKAGIYALEVLYNHEILGSLRIVVEDAM